mmetsp:Transcript_2543/g.2958  ORF Transcript_2543/g.2958 Transcript_2543/m.2958 type:complete len:109 (+) Transcript_2543:957-1283(+)
MIIPVLYSSKSNNVSQARPNIKNGHITQFITKDINIDLKYFFRLKKLKKFSHSTLHNGGIIMTIRPTANGTETPTTLAPLNASLLEGTYTDNNIPKIMAEIIHSGPGS